MTRRRQRVLQCLGSLFTCARAACAFLTLGILIVLLYLGTVGFPPWVVRRIVASLNSGDVAVVARVVKLAPPFSLVLRDVYVYPRRVLGPPILEARRLIFSFSPPRPSFRHVLLKEVIVSDAVFRPELISRTAAADSVAPQTANLPVKVHASLRNCGFQGVVIESLDGELCVTAAAVEVRGARGALEHAGRRGTFSGDATYDRASHKVAGRVKTQCNPHLLIPLMHAMELSFLRELTERFQFGAPVPTTDLWFERTPGDDGQLRLGGTFKGADFSYVGVPVRETAGELDITCAATSTVVRVQPLRIVREEGEGRGGFTVTVSKHVGRVDFDVVSGVHPEAFLRMVGLVRPNDAVPYRFEAPFRIAAQGTADFYGMTNTLFTGQVECGGIGIEKLPVRDCAFDLSMAGTTCRCDNVIGTLYGGNLSQTIEVFLPQGASSATAYHARGTLSHADFETCLKELVKSSSRDMRGDLSGTFDLVGQVGDPDLQRLTGTGTVRIKNGRIFTLPIFGGLSEMLARIVPGINALIGQTDVKTTFTLAEGKVSTDKILIEGGVLSLSGRGAYAFTGDLDFDVQVKLMKEHTLVAKLLRALTYPISKLFEFKLQGQISEPRWYPVNFSSDLLKRIGLVIGPYTSRQDSSRKPTEE
jgi:hypothetical protein